MRPSLRNARSRHSVKGSGVLEGLKRWTPAQPKRQVHCPTLDVGLVHQFPSPECAEDVHPLGPEAEAAPYLQPTLLGGRFRRRRSRDLAVEQRRGGCLGHGLRRCNLALPASDFAAPDPPSRLPARGHAHPHELLSMPNRIHGGLGERADLGRRLIGRERLSPVEQVDDGLLLDLGRLRRLDLMVVVFLLCAHWRNDGGDLINLLAFRHLQIRVGASVASNHKRLKLAVLPHPVVLLGAVACDVRRLNLAVLRHRIALLGAVASDIRRLTRLRP
mmetsp:Transcript_103608/g.299673  ORF Transcript_103608/g.299673 Transcript_103608/m.299673 type:complete len:274 (+) Transcript_103608:290-1111(+)